MANWSGARRIGVAGRTLWPTARTGRARTTPWASRGLAAGAASVGALALLVRLPWLHGRQVFFPAADTPGYVEMARSVGRGAVFAEGGLPRTPGYAWFVWACDLLPGTPIDNVATVQHLLGVALVVGVCLLAWRWLGAAAGLVLGVVLAVSPQLFAIEDEVLPDFLVAFLLAATVALAVAAASAAGRRRWWLCAAVGATAGAATLVKPVAGLGLVALPAALLTTGAGADGGGAHARAVLRGTLIAGGAALSCLLPLMVHNAVTHGKLAVSNQLGVTLFNRVFEVDGRPVPTGPSAQAETVARVAVPRVAQGERIHAAAYSALMDRFGYDGWTAAGVERRLALQEIGRYPVAYARRTVALAAGAAPSGRPDEAAASALLPRAGTSDTAIASWAWGWARRLGDAWWILALHGWAALFAIALARGRARVALTTTLSVVVVGALAIAATHGGLSRYWWELAPLVTLLQVAGAVSVAGALLGALSAGRAGWPSPPSGR